ncbi:MAG: hypothetical protein QM784_06995 [Polyangiaceae bacterium]
MIVPRTLGRGFSKFELLLALSLLTLGGAGVVMISRPSLAKDAEPLATAAAPLIAAATEWRAENPTDCPTIGLLVADGFLDAAVPREDPWGGVFRVQCRNGRIYLHSDGEDQKPGTADDQQIDVP